MSWNRMGCPRNFVNAIMIDAARGWIPDGLAPAAAFKMMTLPAGS
jgi:hypothetical protein